MNPEWWRQIEQLFHAALERPPEARQAFLESRCGRDSELRREVEMLLAFEGQAGAFLEKPALPNSAMAASPVGAGRQFGSYKILSLLGVGGMGEVYRAHDSKLGRDVAVKMLPIEFAADPNRLLRFRREARALATLH